MNVCRIQEGCMWNTRGITTLLGETYKILEEMGYQRNEYDWCVMNNIIDSKQYTILWHVDDLKTSYVEPAVVSRGFLLTLMRNMGRLQKRPSRGAKYINTSG